MSTSYEDVYARAVADPEAFWAAAAEQVHWHKRWTRVLDSSRPPFYRWFVGGEVNTCYNALDRHVEGGRAEQAALIYDSPVTQTLRSFSFRELRDEVAKCAGALAALGVTKGDRVIIYMPMIPEAVIAMLAVARLGAIHSVVFGGFASNELAVRIDDAKPKIIVSASCGIEPGRIVAYKPLIDRAIDLAKHKPDRCIVYQRSMEQAELIPGRDLDWNDVVPARQSARVCSGRGDRPALHPVHVGHDGPAQGRGSRQRRASRGAQLDDAEHLRGRPRRGVLGGLRHRLGCRSLVHCLCAPDPRQHDPAVRGQARRHARRRRVLADHLAAQGRLSLHRADGLSRHQA